MKSSDRNLLAARATLAVLVVFAASLSSTPTLHAAQGGKSTSAKTAPVAAQAPALKRTTTRRETLRLSYGGRLSVVGAPQGSISIESWSKNDVEIVADIELSAGTEEDLARLAVVNGFIIDEEMNHVRIMTTGTHDRKYLKRVARDFPKKLLGLPWKIDYRIRVPAMTDLDISTGSGPVTINNVEGAISLYAGVSEPAALTLMGGDLEASLQGGTVNLDIPARSWRGRGMNLRLVRGDINVTLPAGFNGYVKAEVLRVGRIDNTHPDIAPVERTKPTERSLQGRAGAGGATLSFTVGDGTIRIRPAGAVSSQ